jgi:seryl-tRNA synthetase
MNAVPVTRLTGLQWSDDGYAALSGDLLAWASSLDAHFAGWAEGSGATDYRFPSLIAAKALAPIAYLRSFPHLATFVTSGNRRETSLRSLAEECGTADEIPLRDDRFEPIEHLLTPAACYHFYPRFAGSRLAEPLFLTTRCQCFRREEQYLPLQRQWCFDMRELVCIGDKESIDRFTTDCATLIEGLLGALDLDAAWQTATDPFFDPQADPKALAQVLEPSKQELCTADGLAIASINKHRSFFGESYDIRMHDDAAHSACVAFGVERWLYAMTQRHGTDASAWPPPGEQK